MSISGSFRFPTGQAGSRNLLFDVPTGYGQPGVQVGAAVDAIFNRRYSGTAVGSFTKQLGSIDVTRVPNAANAVFPLSDPGARHLLGRRRRLAGPSQAG